MSDSCSKVTSTGGLGDQCEALQRVLAETQSRIHEGVFAYNRCCHLEPQRGLELPAC